MALQRGLYNRMSVWWGVHPCHPPPPPPPLPNNNKHTFLFTIYEKYAKEHSYPTFFWLQLCKHWLAPKLALLYSTHPVVCKLHRLIIIQNAKVFNFKTIKLTFETENVKYIILKDVSVKLLVIWICIIFERKNISDIHLQSSIAPYDAWHLGANARNICNAYLGWLV